MSRINPMGWGKMPIAKGTFHHSVIPEEQSLCLRLSEILVNRMGIVKQISLETDPITGRQVFNFLLDKESAFPQELLEREIRGIPVRFVH